MLRRTVGWRLSALLGHPGAGRGPEKRSHTPSRKTSPDSLDSGLCRNDVFWCKAQSPTPNYVGDDLFRARRPLSVDGEAPFDDRFGRFVIAQDHDLLGPVLAAIKEADAVFKPHRIMADESPAASARGFH